MARLGFACNWVVDRPAAWSGTPYALSNALAGLVAVADLDVTLPRSQELPLKLASARRDGGRWHSKWRHAPLGKHLVERRLRRLVEREDPDVVLEIQDLARLDRPYGVVHDLSYDLLIDNFGPGGVPQFQTLGLERMLRMRERQRGIYDAASWLFPMSQWLADSLIASGVPSERVHVVNPGVNALADPTAPLPSRRRGARRLLFIGRDFEAKGGHQTVAAFRILRRDYDPALRLTIAGPGRWPLREPPPDGVDFLGPVPPARIQELYDEHDLFVMPSRFEAFGIVFVEALVRGLPCVGRDVCAMPEIISPGDAGLLVDTEDPSDLADTIVVALEDDALYERCAEAAPWWRSHYSWDRAAAQIVSAAIPNLGYEQLGAAAGA